MKKDPFPIENNQSIKGMIDISEKQIVKRTAMAQGRIYLGQDSLNSIRDGTNPKGNVLENAKLSAIYAVKKTPDLVFLAHQIQINSTKVYFETFNDYIQCQVVVIANEKTGVEIEAIAGVMNALLAIFDLCKRYEKDTNGQYKSARITDIKVIEKLKESVTNGLETA
ncbi:MAG: cyclic pyranopterin monophosphate synthase MoaC [Candidatus Kariarchaeaceae archaeon]|jgi:cyclic pyranopterin phosphate synthase